MGNPDFPNTPWATAIATSPHPSEPGTYHVTIPKDWSIANLPLGGYLASLLAAAVSKHFSLFHPNLMQPDPIINHCAFISRASFGPGLIRVSVSKTGRQFSNTLARLYQSPKGTQILVAEALITQGNLTREQDAGGISLPITPPFPAMEIFRRETGVEMVHPPELHHRVPASAKLQRILPAGTIYEGNWSHPVHGPSVREKWIKWEASSGEDCFDTLAIAMLMDNVKPPAYNFPEIERETNWSATMSITTEIKKPPPPAQGSKNGGWEWLFLRVVMGECNFGRYTMDSVLLDESGDVVASGRRIELLLGAERRTREKTKI